MRAARERCLQLPAVLYAGCWLAGSFLLNVYSTSRCDPESPHPRGRALINHDLFSSRLRTSIPPGYLCILTATDWGATPRTWSPRSRKRRTRSSQFGVAAPRGRRCGGSLAHPPAQPPSVPTISTAPLRAPQVRRARWHTGQGHSGVVAVKGWRGGCCRISDAVGGGGRIPPRGPVHVHLSP